MRASLIFAIPSVLVVVACQGELKREHGALSEALDPVQAQLCAIQWAEGGGCHGDCLVTKAATEGRHLRVASELVGRLPIAGDAPTEARLVAARGRASALEARLAPCPGSLVIEHELTAEVRACAAARDALGAEPRELLDALEALHRHVDDATGVTLPAMRGPCPGE